MLSDFTDLWKNWVTASRSSHFYFKGFLKVMVTVELTTNLTQQQQWVKSSGSAIMTKKYVVTLSMLCETEHKYM